MLQRACETPQSRYFAIYLAKRPTAVAR